VPHLNALVPPSAIGFWPTSAGSAMRCSRHRALRINYAIFGNLEPALHAHVHPRYADEPEAMRTTTRGLRLDAGTALRSAAARDRCAMRSARD
jgi:diadenosine tetraphosphate (Ap4A) HIT family hydrolase